MDKIDEIPVNPKNLMTVKDFAVFKGVKRQTVFNWVKAGKVAKVEFLGREWIDKSTLNLEQVS